MRQRVLVVMVVNPFGTDYNLAEVSFHFFTCMVVVHPSVSAAWSGFDDFYGQLINLFSKHDYTVLVPPHPL